MFGDLPDDYFELSVAPEALRELVALGAKALDELNYREVQPSGRL
jgi:hypothetical protein